MTRAATPIVLAVVGLVGLAALGGPAWARCDVDTSGLAFGSITLDRMNRSTAEITVRCDEPTSFEVALTSPGFQRVMTGPGGSVLDYMIFTDPSLTVEWGDGSVIGPRRGAVSDGITATTLYAYGVIPAQGGRTPGTYATTVMVAVIF